MEAADRPTRRPEPSGAAWTIVSGSSRCLADSTSFENEIKLRREAVRRLLRRHDQRWPDVGIVMIPRIALEIQLGRQDRRVLDACLHVNVRGAHVVDSAVVKRLDGAERVATIVAGIEPSSKAETGVVVDAGVIGLPDVEQCPF